MAKSILTRHGQSLWNAENQFTGWVVDVLLSEMRRAEAAIASCKLRDDRVRVCFTRMLLRQVTGTEQSRCCLFTAILS
ncbi:MAG: histidine phosphatase family protein [Leptolyngbyaceae cyanobacterium HOT.MB2.61]|nr:histidine phosphatase family protein [Leptolyngbyaceae cyanobacterium HOT.MB2.61]